MSRIGLALIGVGVALTLGQAAFALPTYGENCASCHTTSLGTITITGNDTTANPVEACSVPDHGTLKVFQVAPGASRTLTATLSYYTGTVSFMDGATVLGSAALVNGSAATVGWFGSIVRRVQSGYLYSYAFWMMIGLALMLGWFLAHH